MAKKTKRKVSSGIRPPAENSGGPVVEAAPRSTTPTFRRTTSFSTEFNPDYTYVIKDLKRIGLLAGTFFTILVVLSFFIR